MARAHRGRSRIGKIVTWITLVLVAIFGIEIGLALSVSPRPDPVQLLNEALTAAGRSAAFHYRAVWRAGAFSQMVVGDARTSSGSESVSVGGSQFSVVLTGQVAYFKGDVVAVRDQLGLPAPTARQSAGEWIALSESDSPYSSVAEGLTTSAALLQVLIAPSATFQAHPHDGVLFSRITGRVPHGPVAAGSARLDLVPDSKLPVLFTAHGSSGGQPWSSTIAFSRWGERTVINAPAGALPFSSLTSSASTTTMPSK